MSGSVEIATVMVCIVLAAGFWFGAMNRLRKRIVEGPKPRPAPCYEPVPEAQLPVPTPAPAAPGTIVIHEHHHHFGAVLLLLGLVVAAVLWVLGNPQQSGGLLQKLPIVTNCTLLVRGHEATITESGFGLNCNAWAQANPTFELVSNYPIYQTICEGDLPNGVHYIVRDSGYLDIYGKTLCNGVKQ